MIKNVFFIFIIISAVTSSSAVGAPSPIKKSFNDGLSLNSVEFFWKEALEIYVTESEDFTETLLATQGELKYWRLRVLQDKFEVKISDLEIVLSKSNQDELGQLEKFVGTKGIDGLDDSLMMRMAQLYYDRAGFDFTAKMKKIKGIKDYSGPIPTPDYSKTVQYTSEIIKRFPRSTLLDHAYYLLGFCLFDEGKDNEGTRVYGEMLKQFPHNALSFEARWRMAEYYFDLGKFEVARANYYALSNSPNPFQRKALYKMGASDYAAENYDSAFKVFFKLYKDSSELLGGADPEAETLYNESLDYLAYLKTKNIKMNLSEDDDSTVTRRMAEVYRKNQDETSARASELSFVNDHIYSKWSPQFMNQAIESYEYENKYVEAQKIRTRFLALYSGQSEFWKKHASDVPIMVEVEDLYESILLSSADYHADLARRRKKSEDYNLAIQYYMKFIDDYPSSPLRNQAKYEMAELQYFSGKFNDAGATYMDMTLDTENDEFRQEAAYGYFLAEVKRLGYDLQNSKDLRPDFDADGNLKPESDLTPLENGFSLAADFYIRNVNGGARRQSVLYKKAEVFFKHNSFKKARELLNTIFKDQALSATATKALHLIAETYNLENNWKKVVETKKKAAELSRRQSFDSIDNEMLFKAKSPILLNAWRLEKKSETIEAAEQYEYYSISYPRASEAPFSLLRSGFLHREAGQIKDSNRVLTRLVKEYKGSEYVPHGLFLLAANQESLLDYDGAAKSYEKIAKTYSKKPIALQAELSGAYLSKALGRPKSAAEHFYNYAVKTQDDAAYFEAADLFKKSGEKARALKIYDIFTTGKKGTTFAVQGYFEKAWITDRYTLAMANCHQALFVAQKSTTALSATAHHSLTGCQYIQTKEFNKNILSHPDKEFDSKWPLLSQAYDSILKSEDEQWIRASLTDLEKLKQAVTKADVTAKYDVVLKAAAQKNVDDFDPSLLPDGKPEAETLAIRWPVDSNVGRVAFDQKKWDLLEKDVGIQLSVKPVGYLYIAQARAQAEKSQWDKAFSSLRDCVSKMKDPVCSAYLTILDPKNQFNGENYEQEDEGIIKLAQSMEMARARKYKETLHLAREAVKAQSSLTDIYKYVAQYYYYNGQTELSQMTLDQGLRNTQGDDRLVVQRGYLALKLKDLEQAKLILDDIKDADKGSAQATILRSHYMYLDGNKEQANAILSILKSADPKNTSVDEAIKAQKMWSEKSQRLPAEESFD